MSTFLVWATLALAVPFGAAAMSCPECDCCGCCTTGTCTCDDCGCCCCDKGRCDGCCDRVN